MPRRAKSNSVSSDTSPTPTTRAATAKASTPARTSAARRSSAASPILVPYRALTNKARSARVPPALRFPLVVLSSFVLSSILFSIVSVGTAGDLAAISKHTESWLEVIGLLGWKTVQLAVCWYGDLDAYDTVALILLISTPHSLLIALFYSIRPTTVLLTLVANIASITAPFVVARQVAPPHRPASAAKGSIRNRSILTDPWTTIATSLLATAIFAVLLELSFATFLPVHLITHFAGVRDLSVTHLGAAGLPSLLVALVPAGYAAREFIFVSSTGTPPSSKKYAFSPATSDLVQHVYHNVWGWYSARQKELIGRTALLAVMVVGETIIQTWGTIKGVELSGAVWFALMWGVGVVVVGTVFDWVGEPSG